MNKKYENFSAIILAGGESKRIGENKALLKIGNKTIIEIIAKKLQTIFNNIIISTNDNSIYSFLNFQIVNDIYKNHGPLSGIHASLINSITEKNFIISCDLPLIDITSIKYILENSENYEITLPLIKNIPLYVCGVYSKSIIPQIDKLIKTDPTKASLKNLIKNFNTNILKIEKEKFFYEINFINMNTIKDYELVKKYYENVNG